VVGCCTPGSLLIFSSSAFLESQKVWVFDPYLYSQQERYPKDKDTGHLQLRPDHQLFILRWYIPRTRKWYEGFRDQVYTIYFFRITVKGFQFTFCIRWSSAAHLFSMPGPGD
jgi:hypothetical protein